MMSFSLNEDQAESASADFSFSKMEDELTCPVCLELYADPLMLACSHSICKKCLQDINKNNIKTKRNTDVLDCPTCRHRHKFTKDVISQLPKNLALENVVFRFQELRSTNMCRSLDSSCGASSPVFNSVEFASFPEESSGMCGLCEEKTPTKASWHCEQCCVLYCQKCFDNFHPRRGPLSHHKVIKARSSGVKPKSVFCADHEMETVTIFCDNCKQLICHLCVCDGVGQHCGHKVVSLDTACEHVKDSLCKAKESAEGLLSNLTESTLKLDELSQEIEKIYGQACQKIDHQYQRSVSDFTAALMVKHGLLLSKVTATKSKSIERLNSHAAGNKSVSNDLESLAETCKKLLDVDDIKSLLVKAKDVEPVITKLAEFTESLKISEKKSQELVSEKKTQQEIQSTVTAFKGAIKSCAEIFLDQNMKKFKAIIPVMKSPTSPGKKEGQRSAQNKCLITWGFNSTTFTAESINQNITWSVNIERNTSHIGEINSGYLFGVGVATEILNCKDNVGMNPKSYGIVCHSGNIVIAHDGKMEQVIPLDGLPVSVTICVDFDQPEIVIFSYVVTCPKWGDILQGKKLLETSFCKALHPAFTVSQRVKVHFPTYV